MQIKQTLALVNQTLRSQDGVMNELETKYPFILKPQTKQGKKEKNEEQVKTGGGVLV